VKILAYLPDAWLRMIERACVTVAPVATSSLRLDIWLERYSRDTRRAFAQADRHGWPSSVGL
jgi:hypothetical protein